MSGDCDRRRKETMEQDTGWKTRALLVGGVLGALLGVGTTYLLLQRAEREGEPLSIGTGEGIRLGMLVMGMLRQVAQIGDKKG
jgi:hypothetical protein